DCTQLVALDITISDSQIIAMNELRKVIATSRNLQRLSLKCVSDTARRGEGRWLIGPGVKLPPLKFLKLRGVEFADYNEPGWQSCVSWDALEYLECTELDFTFLCFRPPPLKELRSLTLINPRYPRTVNSILNFLDGLTKLEHLTMTGSSDCVLASTSNLLEQTGPSLKTLKVHEIERNNNGSNVPRSVPTEEEIRRIGRRCTQLETCALDILGVTDWVEARPKDALNAQYTSLTCFDSLQPWGRLSMIAESLWFIIHLELDIELLLLGILKVTLESVREIWNFLWADITRVRKERNHLISRPRLRTLKISTSLTKMDTATFEARLSERDDLATKGHADVVCLQLEGLEEKYGNGPLDNDLMEKFRSDLVSRAEKGTPLLRPITGDSFTHVQARPLKTTLSTMADWEAT
ncbi:MAG: hypothetical protein Q9224_006115, partial [Gallowayella concinna]